MKKLIMTESKLRELVAEGAKKVVEQVMNESFENHFDYDEATDTINVEFDTLMENTPMAQDLGFGDDEDNLVDDISGMLSGDVEIEFNGGQLNPGSPLYKAINQAVARYGVGNGSELLRNVVEIFNAGADACKNIWDEDEFERNERYNDQAESNYWDDKFERDRESRRGDF